MQRVIRFISVSLLSLSSTHVLFSQQAVRLHDATVIDGSGRPPRAHMDVLLSTV